MAVFTTESENPVAFSILSLDLEVEIIVRNGFTTLEKFRGRNIYSSLVAKRLADDWVLGGENRDYSGCERHLHIHLRKTRFGNCLLP